MPTVTLGNESVIEHYKPDPGKDDTKVRPRKDLGKRVTTMSLNETDGADNPSRAMNLQMLTRLWEMHSDKPPTWVEGDDDLLVQLAADHFSAPVGRPKSWKEG